MQVKIALQILLAKDVLQRGTSPVVHHLRRPAVAYRRQTILLDSYDDVVFSETDLLKLTEILTKSLLTLQHFVSSLVTFFHTVLQHLFY